jgi:hypothetical protein
MPPNDIADVTEIAAHPESIPGLTEWGGWFVLFKNVTGGIGLLTTGKVHQQRAIMDFFRTVLGSPVIDMSEATDTESFETVAEKMILQAQETGTPDPRGMNFQRFVGSFLQEEGQTGIYFWEADRLEKFLATKRG